MQVSNNKKFIVSLVDIGKEFNEVELFKHVSFTIAAGEKVGLVGPNGSGKTTLIKILLGGVEPSEGRVTKGKDVTVQYLPQVHTESGHLSGGEMARQVLAPIIAADADLCVLDEPTNNLDLEGLRMVEEFVQKSAQAFLIVSHDRAFLDATVERIIEVDSATKTIVQYEGNYSAFAEARAARVERQWREYSDKQDKQKRLGASVEQRLDWMNKIVQKRMSTKKLPKNEKEKPQAAGLRDKEAAAGRRARQMQDKLERYTEESAVIVKPPHLLPLHIDFPHERGSTNVFAVDAVVKGFGEKQVGPITKHIQYGDRVHIVGANGSGKTTFLKMLLGELQPDSGTVERGENVVVGYVPQERWVASTHKTVIEEFLAITNLEESDARKILNRFRITTEDVQKDVSQISPGEYSRLVIAELVALKPNCIILDEPSNHLDLEVLEELERGLAEYSGTLIVVSHDRYFIEKLHLTGAIELV